MKLEMSERQQQSLNDLCCFTKQAKQTAYNYSIIWTVSECSQQVARQTFWINSFLAQWLRITGGGSFGYDGVSWLLAWGPKSLYLFRTLVLQMMMNPSHAVSKSPNPKLPSTWIIRRGKQQTRVGSYTHKLRCKFHYEKAGKLPSI